MRSLNRAADARIEEPARVLGSPLAPQADQAGARHGSSLLAGAPLGGLGAVELVATGEGQHGQEKRSLHGPSRLNRFLLVVNLALAGACGDGSDLQSTQDAPKNQPPPSGYSHPSGDAGTPATPLSFTDVMRLGLAPTRPASVTPHVDPTSPRPTPGPVELRQSRLDTWPTMGPCPDWGAPAGAGWVQAFRYASPYSNTYPDGQPNNCKQIPPQSHIPYLTPYTYPTNVSMNDKVRAFFSWATYLQCIRVTLKEHDWGGGTVTYQGCNTTPNTYLYVWSPNVQSDAGYDLGVTQVTVEWWAI